MSLIPLIQSLLTEEPEAKIHLLLNSAVFEEDPQASASVHLSLRQLQDLLCDSLGKNNAPIPHVYLFDRNKEGVWEARDAAEVQIILGNFLLAMLSGGLAQRLAHSVTQLDIVEGKAFFGSAAATAIVFDIERVRRACAMRLGAEILDCEFHSKIAPNPGPVEEMSDYFIENHANKESWWIELCRETSFHVQADGQRVDFHLSDLRFENVPMEDWVKSIHDYDRTFHERCWPAQTSLLNENAKVLNADFLRHFNMFANLLPQVPRLYPGGPRSARLVLERIRRELMEEQHASSDGQAIEREWEERIKDDLERLEAALHRLPKPPRWVYRLPPFLRSLMIQVFRLVFWRKELQAALSLRQNCVRLLEEKYSALFEQALIKTLMELRKGWIEALDGQLKRLARLQSTLDRVHRRMERRKADMGSTSSLFRLSALNESVMDWVYYSGKRPQEGFRLALLGGQNFLRDWQKTTAKTLETRLMNFCTQVYASLADVNLEEALRRRGRKDADALALALMQGAVPLLRPNFDQTGSGSSFQLRFFQSNDPRSSSLSPALRKDLHEWQEIGTDDPYLAIVSRVRLLIPLSALSHVLDRGREAFEAEEIDS